MNNIIYLFRKHTVKNKIENYMIFLRVGLLILIATANTNSYGSNSTIGLSLQKYTEEFNTSDNCLQELIAKEINWIDFGNRLSSVLKKSGRDYVFNPQNQIRELKSMLSNENGEENRGGCPYSEERINKNPTLKLKLKNLASLTVEYILNEYIPKALELDYKNKRHVEELMSGKKQASNFEDAIASYSAKISLDIIANPPVVANEKEKYIIWGTLNKAENNILIIGSDLECQIKCIYYSAIIINEQTKGLTTNNLRFGQSYRFVVSHIGNQEAFSSRQSTIPVFKALYIAEYDGYSYTIQLMGEAYKSINESFEKSRYSNLK